MIHYENMTKDSISASRAVADAVLGGAGVGHVVGSLIAACRDENASAQGCHGTERGGRRCKELHGLVLPRAFGAHCG